MLIAVCSKSKSKFSKRAEMNNPNTRAAVESQLRIRAQLLKKIKSADATDDFDDDALDDEELDEPIEEPKTGVMAMRFMKRMNEQQKFDAERAADEDGDTLSHAEILRKITRDKNDKKDKDNSDVVTEADMDSIVLNNGKNLLW